jgi:hypothetical protein
MRIACLITRKNYYRLLGPVVEEALARGHAVECWHDWSGPRTGPKGSEFPDAAPRFPSGAPAVKTCQGAADLSERLGLDPPDALVSIDPPPPELRARVKAPWIWLQYAADILFQPTPRGIQDADAVALYGPAWVGMLERRFGREQVGPGLARKAWVVGAPELDLVHRIDRDEVRRRLGLPADRPIVLYLPFPLRSNVPTPWLRHVHAPSTRLEQGLRTLLAGRREYWSHVARGWNDRRLVEAVRAFCDRNGAALVMKARRKDPLPRYAERLADRAFYDLSHYPATILELLSVAALCIHFYSTTALEAAYCGVPSLCLAPREDELGPRSFGFAFIHNGAPGGLYNVPGVAYWRPLVAAFDGLRGWRLSDFPLEAGSRRRYLERYLACDDGRSSGRLLDAVARAVEADACRGN